MSEEVIWYTPWYTSNEDVDPRLAPGHFFRVGVHDGEEGHFHRTVNPLYQRNYDDGFSHGQWTRMFIPGVN